MTKEIGKKLTLAAAAYTFLLATALGVATRWVHPQPQFYLQPGPCSAS